MDRADRGTQATESGFGLIEIVISMFLISLLAMAFLPLLIQGLRISVSNTTLATSTQLVNQQLDLARGTGTTCNTLSTFAAGAIAPVVDPRGVSLQAHLSPISCPASYPATVTLRAWVTQAGSTTVLAEATTLIFVSAAS
jgi:type II secretory pathway pseudopilin PulG